MKYLTSLLIIIVLFSGCSHKTSDVLKAISYGQYQEVSFQDLPSWEDEDFDEALEIFQKTCKKSSRKPLFAKICAKSESSGGAREFFELNFTPFVSLSDTSLATGYYEPTLEGSYTKSKAYPYAVYGVPNDLVRVELIDDYKSFIKRPLRGRLVDGKLVPYFSRQEISENALSDEEPLCYVSDKIDLFFLQVQGSGRVRLEDNSTLYLGYGDQNGYPYESIGKEMIQRGCLAKEEVSLSSIYEYLSNNPHEIDDILNSNPSYVFFQKRKVGASGALGLRLEAGRSVAVDKKNIPLGMPLFISTHEPISNDTYERMVFAHDTGGAIKGESRIDIFFGSGKKAKEQAGLMQEMMKLWMLVPNDYLIQSKE